MKAVLRDAAKVFGLAVGYLATALIPQRLDRWILGWTGALVLRLKSRNVGRVSARIDSIVGPAPATDSLRRAQDQYRLRLENAWGRARGLHVRGWRPELGIEGFDQLESALSRGRGAILWRMQFCSTPLAKRALWEAGVPLVHLGAFGHGAQSKGWIGLGILEPMIRRSEDWYLEERVMMRSRSDVAYAKTLMSRLRQNKVVLIFGDLWGLNPVTSPFFDGTASFATGAPSMAWKTGAELLAMYVVREGNLRYRTVIEEAIATDRTLGRREFAHKSVEEFTKRLQRAVERHPGSWSNWGAFLGGYRPFQRGSVEPGVAART